MIPKSPANLNFQSSATRIIITKMHRQIRSSMRHRLLKIPPKKMPPRSSSSIPTQS